MNRLLALLDIPIRLCLWAAIGAGVLMMIHVTADVAMRTLFNSPIEGTTEVVAAYSMVIVAYLPLADALAASARGHAYGCPSAAARYRRHRPWTSRQGARMSTLSLSLTSIAGI